MQDEDLEERRRGVPGDIVHGLSGWLREVAAADASTGASPAVRERLLEEVRSRRLSRRTALLKMYALAAGLVVATAMPVWHLTTRLSSDEPSRTAIDIPLRATSTGDAEVATAFFPLAYGAVPVTQGNIVRVAVSPAAVAALGVEPMSANGSPGDVLLADVLVGEDGLARAVRFVRSAR
jgi:hypothetical protein